MPRQVGYLPSDVPERLIPPTDPRGLMAPLPMNTQWSGQRGELLAQQRAQARAKIMDAPYALQNAVALQQNQIEMNRFNAATELSRLQEAQQRTQAYIAANNMEMERQKRAKGENLLKMAAASGAYNQAGASGSKSAAVKEAIALGYSPTEANVIYETHLQEATKENEKAELDKRNKEFMASIHLQQAGGIPYRNGPLVQPTLITNEAPPAGNFQMRSPMGQPWSVPPAAQRGSEQKEYWATTVDKNTGQTVKRLITAEEARNGVAQPISPLSVGAAKESAQNELFVKQLDQLDNDFKKFGKNYVGPTDMISGWAKSKFNNAEAADFRALLAGFSAAFIRRAVGAAMSENEKQLWFAALPTTGDSDAEFAAKLRITREGVSRINELMLEKARKLGVQNTDLQSDGLTVDQAESVLSAIGR
jgi:hypothetical protein